MREECRALSVSRASSPRGVYRYRAYGLLFSSEMAIPHFPEAGDGPEEPDVHIRRGEIFGSGYTPPPTIQVEAAEGKFLLRGAKTASILVTGGTSITVEPLPGSDPATVQQLLLGWAFAGLFHQRSMLPLHGSSVCRGDECFVLCAPSGGGKSTLTASFLKRGFSFLDDNVALAEFRDGMAFIASGSPELRLWENSMQDLEFEHEIIGRIRPDKDKTSVIARGGFRGESARLARIFILKRDAGPEISFVNLTGAARFRALMENVFCIRFMKDCGCAPALFHRVLKLAECVPVTDVLLPRRLPPPDELCDIIIGTDLLN